MDRLLITGGNRLTGNVSVSGSKNAALPIMAASLLADGPVCLQRVPTLTDVATLFRLLRDLGMQVQKDSEGDIRLQTVDLSAVRARYQWLRKMRAGFCVLGPLLARRGKAIVSLPGGCPIGLRPVDLHLKALVRLGANIQFKNGYVIASTKGLVGANIDMLGPRGPTVTGTANVISAATLAKGETIIRNAAREPEIVDLGQFLIAIGANIEGLGSETIQIRGVDMLGGATHRVIPDRIEAATLLIGIAVSGGRASVSELESRHLISVLGLLKRAGCDLKVEAEKITIAVDVSRLQPIHVDARPYPGVPTDVQAQLTVLAALANGNSTIRDSVFPQRFAHLAELARLGVWTDVRGDLVHVVGGHRLSGTDVRATDLRASAALILAGIAAAGKTRIHDAAHLLRGYEGLDEKLSGLGADIQRQTNRRMGMEHDHSVGPHFDLRIPEAEKPLH